MLAQAIAIVLVTPWNFVGNKLWSFGRGSGASGRARGARARRAAGGAPAPTEPVFDEDGRLVETPFVPAEGGARLTEEQATAILFRHGKVADWLDRYPPKPQTDAEYRPATRRVGREGLVGQGGPDRAREGRATAPAR